jgi:predicted nucleic acid-binding protein
MSDNENEVIIPAIVLAEMLCDLPSKKEREDAVSYISTSYEVMEFDVMCSLEFSRLRIIYDEKNKEQFAHPENTPKCKVLNDYLICASAIEKDCDAIFTNNEKDFEKFANNEIPIYSLKHVDTIKEEEQQIKIQREQRESFGTIQFPDNEENDQKN